MSRDYYLLLFNNPHLFGVIVLPLVLLRWPLLFCLGILSSHFQHHLVAAGSMGVLPGQLASSYRLGNNLRRPQLLACVAVKAENTKE
jgi:hypothetical protein